MRPNMHLVGVAPWGAEHVIGQWTDRPDLHAFIAGMSHAKIPLEVSDLEQIYDLTHIPEFNRAIKWLRGDSYRRVYYQGS
jgi:hypothetical protein